MRKLLFLIITFLALITNVSAINFETYSNNIIIYNLDTKSILYEKNSNDEVKVASLTKIMTAIIVIENNPDLDKIIEIKDEDLRDMYEYATAGFQAGDKVKLKDIVYGILLPSGSDAVNAAVRETSTTEEEFIKLMNQKVDELNLTHTHFSNAVGKDEDNYSTASDIQKILEYALKNKTFYEIFNTQKYIIEDLNLQLNGPLYKVERKYKIDPDYILGAKTGYTGESKYSMASYSKYNDSNYILVTVGAPNFKKVLMDTDNLYNYVFENYDYYKYNINFNLDIINGEKSKYNVNLNTNLYLLNNYDQNLITYKYDGIKEITYKQKKGDKLGTISIYYDNKLLKQENIFLTKKLTYKVSAYNNLILSIIFPIILISSLLVIIVKIKKYKYKKKNTIHRPVVVEKIKIEESIEYKLNILKRTNSVSDFFNNIKYIKNQKQKEQLEINFIDRCFSNIDFKNINELKELNTKFRLYGNDISTKAYDYFMKTMKYCIELSKNK